MPGLLESFVLLALTSAGLSGAALGIAVPAVVGAIGVVASIGLSYLSSLLFKPEQPKPQDVQVSVKNPVAPRQRHYGRVKASGPWVFGESKSGALHKVIALGTGELDAVEELWIDDNLVTIDGGGWVQTEPYGPGDSRVQIKYRLGLATETHYSDLTSVFPEWDSAHTGNGVSSLYSRQLAVGADNFTEVFPNSANTLYRVVARGSKVYNPSTGTTVWSENAAAIIRDYMTHQDGMRLPASLFTTAQAQAGWLAAYNRAALAITKKAGGTEGAYRLWGTYKFDERPADVLGRMLQCCDGRIIPTPDGGVTLDIGTWTEPTVTIDEDTITGFSELSRGRDILTTANVISATFLSPTHDYQSTDADQWRDEDDVDLRGEIVSDLSFNMAPSHGQARRLMKLAAYRANPSWIGTFQCNLKALAAFGKRFVRITYPLFSIDEVFEIVDFRFTIGEGGILQGVTLQVQSMPEGAYEWDAATEEGTEPISEDVTVDRTIPVPANFTFTEGTVTVGGEPYSVGLIAFDEPPSESLKVEGRFKQVSDPDTAWQIIPISPEATSAQTGILDDGVEYEAQVRHVTITGRVSEWTASETMTPLSDPVAPVALSSFGVTGGNGNATLTFSTAGGDSHLKRIAIYRVPAGEVLDKNTDFAFRVAAAPGTSFGYVDGDATITTLLTNGTFSADTDWTKNPGWTIAGGFAVATTAANGTAVIQAEAFAAGTNYRVKFEVSSYSAGGVRAVLVGGTNVPFTTRSANGTYLETKAALTGNADFYLQAIGTTTLNLDNAVLFAETPACAPQGVWDYYAIPENGSGVEGPQATAVEDIVIV